MSVSDAAPLPRLGEVFFDVRGNSRSMRLSWYADTGVAVFSIWQAGMCTGTFRLPIADLSRMIEILERGPSPQGRGRPPVSGGRRGPERGRDGRDAYPADEDEIGLLDATSGAGRYAAADYSADYGGSSHAASGQYATGGLDGRSSAGGERGPGDRDASYRYDDADGGTAAYPAADYGSAGYGNAGYEPAGDNSASYDAAAYQPADYRSADYRSADYRSADYRSADYRSEGYGGGGYAGDEQVRRGGRGGADYAPDSYRAGSPDYLTGEHPAVGYHDGTRADRSPDYLSGGYGTEQAFPAGGHRRDDGRFPPDPGGVPSAGTDGTGYHEERFVPPYVRGGGESYRNDNRAEAPGYESDVAGQGYPADAPSVSPSDGYYEPPWPGEAYSYGAEYRRR
jgi:hypothetical protein